jgi:hypothetical protein
MMALLDDYQIEIRQAIIRVMKIGIMLTLWSSLLCSPKRLYVQQFQRTLEFVNGTKTVDSGLFVNPFDYLGLRTHHYTFPAIDLALCSRITRVGLNPHNVQLFELTYVQA